MLKFRRDLIVRQITTLNEEIRNIRQSFGKNLMILLRQNSPLRSTAYLFLLKRIADRLEIKVKGIHQSKINRLYGGTIPLK